MEHAFPIVFYVHNFIFQYPVALVRDLVCIVSSLVYDAVYFNILYFVNVKCKVVLVLN